jgi:hypothetical protein
MAGSPLDGPGSAGDPSSALRIGQACEQVIARADHHVREPPGDILVPQHVQQG